ncbi:cell division protein FtsK [Mycobacterium frederiksbergense]|uniref:FtsK/SpoIIIE domain-containing protein n=1 Tax=Mycobacteriaceae TaxID=1762 RepID=UPI0009B11393|nr:MULTISPECIES: FtsK/SpoIIIE domain-containing protein [Mycobacteriaceae]MBF9315836.1 cell division protein FtsK [Mycobacteroides chelonae]MCV7043091.1 cell division protein FtsK [Mycolicibacterium frederiksbergense]MDO3140334.1 FtsK/SpoIIIE domain-containing protein [Mycobacteroides abscessus subsp. abscessus]MDO3154206.1 FtsK/SpoIIIE domain-containing protein [Mycobacteroides abscessus subsp. abscessus]RIR33739.1 cell division protein FtsK [Mycobacteroides abscessus]
MFDSSNARKPKASGSTESEWDETITLILTGVAKGLGVLIWWSVLFPMISLPLLVSLWVGIQYAPILGLLVAVASGTTLAAWACLSPESFDEWITARMRSRWRTWWIYRHRWETICTLHGLTASMANRTLVPTLRSVSIGATRDVVVVQILVGQSAADWQKKTLALAEAFRAERVTVRSHKPGEVNITVHHGDALAVSIRLRRPIRESHADLTNIDIGIIESGKPWRIPVLGHHILVAGATGAGKGSVLWSLISGLAPGIRAGTVRILVVDPKGGMEFGRGQRLFAGFAYDNGERTLALLRAAAQVMQHRAQRLRGHTRLHTPSTSAPLLVVVVDEIASLTAYISDRKVRSEIEQLLGLLLSQGRAVGVSVVAAVQDPSKDVLPIRQLFSVRVGMRMTETTQTTMVLGAAARDAGALCDEISTATPGVAYVCQDGRAEPLRVRAFHVADDDIDYLAEHFSPCPGKSAR